MKTMKTSFQKMLSAVPADVQQEIDMEVAISNRINELMEKRGLSKLEFAQALVVLTYSMNVSTISVFRSGT